jgi:hypothetical protein
LHEAFGTRFLIFLTTAQHVVKGFFHSIVTQANRVALKDLGLDAPTMEIITGVVGLPWAFKPGFGLLSDFFPIAGYCKGPYVLVVTLLSVAALVVLFMFGSLLQAKGLASLLFVLMLHISVTDLLSEAIYARCLRDRPDKSPAVLTYVWGGITLAGMLAMVCNGVLLQNLAVWSVYGFALIPAATALVPLALGYVEEPKLSPAEVKERRVHICKQSEVLFLCAVMVSATIGLLVTGLFFRAWIFYASFVVFVCVLLSFSLCLTPLIAKVKAFQLIQKCLHR